MSEFSTCAESKITLKYEKGNHDVTKNTSNFDFYVVHAKYLYILYNDIPLFFG